MAPQRTACHQRICSCSDGSSRVQMIALHEEVSISLATQGFNTVRIYPKHDVLTRRCSGKPLEGQSIHHHNQVQQRPANLCSPSCPGCASCILTGCSKHGDVTRARHKRGTLKVRASTTRWTQPGRTEACKPGVVPSPPSICCTPSRRLLPASCCGPASPSLVDIRIL